MSCLTACGARRHGRDGRPHRPRVGKPAPASASRGRAFYASVYPSVSARRLPLSAPHRRTAQDDFCRTGEETVFGFPLRACIPHKNFISVFFGSARPRAAFPRRRNKPAPLRPVPPAPHSAAHRPAAARGLAAPPGEGAHASRGLRLARRTGGGGRLRAGSAIRNIERIPQDRRAVGRRASAAGPAVVAVSIKSRTESEQNTASLWSDAKTSDTGRTTPSCPLALRQGWTQRPAALNCRKAASANKRTCLGGSSGN